MSCEPAFYPLFIGKSSFKETFLGESFYHFDQIYWQQKGPSPRCARIKLSCWKKNWPLVWQEPGINYVNIGIANFWAWYIQYSIDVQLIFAEVMRTGPPFLDCSVCIYNSIFGSWCLLKIAACDPKPLIHQLFFYPYFLQALKPAIPSNELLWNNPLCTEGGKGFHLCSFDVGNVHVGTEFNGKNHRQLIMSSSHDIGVRFGCFQK